MPVNQLPPEKREAVDEALRAAFSTTMIDILSPMGAGLSSALVYRAMVRGRNFLLRIETVRDGFRDPARHYACLRIAAETGIAPPVRFADAGTGVAIMDFIEARPLNEYPGGPAGIARELSRLLARLQKTAVFPSLVDYLDGVDAVIAAMLATGILDETAAATPVGAYRQIRDAYPRLGPAALVSSHNDLNPNNLLYDGRRLWLVDWESAFANDPHVDLAMVANFFGVQGEAEDAMLATLFGEAGEIRRARLWLMRQVCNMFYATMMLNLVAAARGPDSRPIGDLDAPSLEEVRRGLGNGTVDVGRTDGQLLFAKALLNEVTAKARSPAFAAASRQLAA